MLAGLTNYWQAEPAPSRPWRSLAAILLILGDRRSLAPYCCGLAREQRLVGILLLAGRSLAAIWFALFSERDQREPERSEGSSRARSAATRWQRHLPFVFILPGRGRFHPVSSDLTTSECSGTETKLAQLQCSGMERRQSDESGPVSGFPYRRGRNRADPDRATGGGVSHTGHLRSP